VPKDLTLLHHLRVRKAICVCLEGRHKTLKRVLPKRDAHGRKS
jgi:hypothetical protein